MQHSQICNYHKIINTTITTDIQAVCFFPFTAKPPLTPLNKNQCLSGDILYQCFLSYFVHLLLLSFLFYSLFNLILILPLDVNMLKINEHTLYFCSSHNKKLSKSHFIRPMFNFKHPQYFIIHGFPVLLYACTLQ